MNNGKSWLERTDWLNSLNRGDELAIIRDSSEVEVYEYTSIDKIEQSVIYTRNTDEYCLKTGFKIRPNSRTLDDTRRICLPSLVPVELKERYELLNKLSSYKTWEAVSLHKLKQVWKILNS
jgi:hypothetical protein